MVERIAQHRHCRNCDKAIPYKDKFCDEKCETDHKSEMKRKKNQLLYFYAMTIIVLILSMALIFLR